jgi:hypothetical protein
MILSAVCMALPRKEPMLVLGRVKLGLKGFDDFSSPGEKI